MELPPSPPLPAAVQTGLWMRRPIELMRQSFRRYGPTFRIRLAPIGEVIFLTEPEHIKTIFTRGPDEAHAGETNIILEPMVGSHSVLLLDGQPHMRHRRMMLPSFHGERMRLYGPTMRDVTERCVDEWPEGSTFSLHTHTQEITLDVILRTVFGLDQGPRMDALRAALKRQIGIVDTPLAALTMIPAFRRDLPGTPWRRFLLDRARTDGLIFKEVARRRREGTDGRDDVFSLLLEATDEDGQRMSDIEIRDELITLLLAGHETTATSLCWTVERVLSSPGVYEKLRDEVRTVVGEGGVEPEHLSKLEYLEATLREAQRTRPVVPIVGRKLCVPLDLDPWHLEAGSIVAPCIYMTHHRPDLYPDPEAFRPERFVGTRPDPYKWFPFGGGVRRCLGMAFAMYEMKMVLATMLSRVDFELAEPRPVAMRRRAITFSPKGGTRVRIRHRRIRSRPRHSTPAHEAHA